VPPRPRYLKTESIKRDSTEKIFYFLRQRTQDLASARATYLLAEERRMDFLFFFATTNPTAAQKKAVRVSVLSHNCGGNTAHGPNEKKISKGRRKASVYTLRAPERWCL